MDKEKETMADEQTVQPQEVENGTENKTVRKRISWGADTYCNAFHSSCGWGKRGDLDSLLYYQRLPNTNMWNKRLDEMSS